MKSKVDYKKHEKILYIPGAAPTIVDVPELPYLAIQGQGDPNEPPFAQATAALYSLSYAVKMSYKRPDPPEGYYDYTVYPLEGVWDLVDKSVPHTVKSNLKYTLMIRQPDFLTEAMFERFRDELMRKKPDPDLEKVAFAPYREGLCCQMLHVGPYDDEPASFAAMEAYCEENGYRRASLLHREIYLSDARKTEPARLRTVLRFTVAPST